MAWFWDAYTTDPAQRAEITASPLRAFLADLEGLPPVFVIVDENDVLRDEGEAYARKLIAAGVPTTSVRYNGTLHDFMMPPGANKHPDHNANKTDNGWHCLHPNDNERKRLRRWPVVQSRYVQVESV